VNTGLARTGSVSKIECAVELFPSASFVLIVTGKTITERYWCLFLVRRENGALNNYIYVVHQIIDKKESNYSVREQDSAKCNAAERFHWTADRECWVRCTTDRVCWVRCTTDRLCWARCTTDARVLGALYDRPPVLGALYYRPRVLGTLYDRPPVLGALYYRPRVLGALYDRVRVLGALYDRPRVLGALYYAGRMHTGTTICRIARMNTCECYLFHITGSKSCLWSRNVRYLKETIMDNTDYAWELRIRAKLAWKYKYSFSGVYVCMWG
jgi:hypothetical protein